MNKDAVFIYSYDFTRYKFSEDHPFDADRTNLTYELLNSLDCFEAGQVIIPQKASDEEILLAHRQDYVEYVKKVSSAGHKANKAEASQFGLGTEENPLFPELHNSASLIAGATLTGLKHILEKKGSHALNLSGGLHHALPGRASGFCVYNDINIAIAYLKKNYGYKVLYVDTDAHHGDGVQWHFYDDPDVCTISLHETGRYLFPGTGSARERGVGQGYGFTFNIPLDAFTEDASFKSVFTKALLNVAEYFQPDLIISQHGADGHFTDRLSHLCLTTETYRYIPQLIHKVAHTFCEGRWLALGGGGYNEVDIVPKIWAFIWLEMNDYLLKNYSKIPLDWIELIFANYGKRIGKDWGDSLSSYVPIPRQAEITAKNQKTLEDALMLITKPKILGYLSKDNE